MYKCDDFNEKNKKKKKKKQMKRRTTNIEQSKYCEL